MTREERKAERVRLLRLAYSDGARNANRLSEYERHSEALLAVEAWILRDLELMERGKL